MRQVSDVHPGQRVDRVRQQRRMPFGVVQVGHRRIHIARARASSSPPPPPPAAPDSGPPGTDSPPAPPRSCTSPLQSHSSPPTPESSSPVRHSAHDALNSPYPRATLKLLAIEPVQRSQKLLVSSGIAKLRQLRPLRIENVLKLLPPSSPHPSPDTAVRQTPVSYPPAAQTAETSHPA